MLQARQRLYHMVLIAAAAVLVRDWSSRGAAQAWTYNYSTSPRRWLEARQWCRQHFTDLVPIRNQEESDFINSLLPFSPRYYWVGVHKEGGEWIWVGDQGERVPKEAQNWAPDEPDTILSQDCVEMYVKRDKDETKWNNENCRKRKGTACYSASCRQGSCGAHADCLETVGSHTCRCHPGFSGSRCEEANACEPLLDPDHGSHSCLHPHGSNRFNSSCRFRCDLGFRLVGVSQLLCRAGGLWSHAAPLCRVERCPAVNDSSIRAGRLSCSHPIAASSYNSTCEVRCDEGYEASGPDHIRCDHTGQWTASVPACSIKTCSPTFFPVAGNVTCVDVVEPFSFGSRCNFTCQEGYFLPRGHAFTCLASGQWSDPAPECTVVQCSSLEAPPHASIQCRDPVGAHSYGSTCTTLCERGFDLIGTNTTECSSQGGWSHALPVCQATRCDPINPSHGSLFCSDPNGSFSFGSSCTVTCDQGFLLNGTASSECTSLGQWSADAPLCLARRCLAVNPPSHGSTVCSGPHGESSFASRCTSACEEGFVLNGTADTECTSLGTWSSDIPRCLALKCPPLAPPSHGYLFCLDPHAESSFGSRCTSACEEGFVLHGPADTECTSLGRWSSETPHCLAQPCPLLAKALHDGRMNCSHPHSPFSYGSHCGFQCSEGFWLRGAPAVTCNTSGLWSDDEPSCQPVQCDAIHASSLSLSVNCSHPLGNFSFSSQCLFSCEEGFGLNGTELLLCSSSGVWNDSLPSCMEDRPVGSAMLLSTGTAAASVVLPLVLIATALLFIIVQCKRRGKRTFSDAAVWPDRENPVFGFET